MSGDRQLGRGSKGSWANLVKQAAAATRRTAQARRDQGPGPKAKMYGAGPGFNRELTPEEVTSGFALAGLLDKALLDPKVRMRVDGDGSRTSTVPNWVQKVAMGDSKVLVDWQKRMYRAGLYETEPVYGYFDQATAGALSFLATDVIRNGNRKTPSQILDILTSAADRDGDGKPDNGGSGGNGQRQGATFAVTNPLDLREQAQNVSSKLMGREVADPQADALMAGYRQMELDPQRQAQTNADTSVDGVVTQAPSAQAYAEEQLRQSNATEIDSYATLGAFNEVLRMVGLAG